MRSTDWWTRSGRRCVVVAALALGWALFSVAEARAATVTHRFVDVVYTAAPGEVNRVTIERKGEDLAAVSWLITDPGAVITPSAPCASLDAHSVRCPYLFDSMRFATARLGDGNDRLTTIMPGVSLVGGITADGGPGDDWIAGSDGLDTLTGGDGRDVLYGEANDDVLAGGDGRDALYGGAGLDRLYDGDPAGGSTRPEADLLDGGPDSDTVSYAGRTRPISIDLADAGPVDGERGEGDTLIDIENVSGGKGADRLAGNGTDNWIDGLGGRDRLIGRGGNDVLSGGGGRISCGSGRDSVVPAGRALDYLDRGCEELQLAWPTNVLTNGPMVASAYPVRVRRRSVGFWFVSCPGMEDEVARCTAGVGLRETFGAHRLLARGTVPRRRYGTPARVSARLTPVGRRLARRRRGVRATVDFRMQGYGAWAGVLHARWGIRLKLPGTPKGT